MAAIEGLLSLRVGKVTGEVILSPSHQSFNWQDGILTSTCERHYQCPNGHPVRECTCGIYSVLDNGLHELANYIHGANHLVFIGWAFSTVHRYEWGLRSGQWVAVGVVNWHGLYDHVISPDNAWEPWWDSAYTALELFRTKNVDKPRLYSLETAQKAIHDQLINIEERNSLYEKLFTINQKGEI